MNFGVILGTGLDNIVHSFKKIKILKEDNTGVHNKRIYTAYCDNNVKVLLLCGRKHYYEGCNYNELTENIAYAKDSGIKYLVITNAAGGINNNYINTDLMIIRSYVNFISSINKFQKNIYIDNSFLNLFKAAAKKSKVNLHQGTYGYFTGPAYETPAEIRFLNKIGIDAAGMSTIPELSEAINNDMKVIALSVITNLLKENISSKTAHNSVISTASHASYKLGLIINELANELKNC